MLPNCCKGNIKLVCGWYFWAENAKPLWPLLNITNVLSYRTVLYDNSASVYNVIWTAAYQHCHLSPLQDPKWLKKIHAILHFQEQYPEKLPQQTIEFSLILFCR